MEKLERYVGFIIIIVVIFILLLVFAYPKVVSEFKANIIKSHSQGQTQQKEVPQVKIENVKTNPSSKGTLQVSSPCTGVSLPVCGVDGNNYASQCLADFLGVKVASQGICPRQIIQ